MASGSKTNDAEDIRWLPMRQRAEVAGAVHTVGEARSVYKIFPPALRILLLPGPFYRYQAMIQAKVIMELYESLPLSDGSCFRLLDLDFDQNGAKSDEDTIHATIDVYSFENAPQYKALSYA